MDPSVEVQKLEELFANGFILEDKERKSELEEHKSAHIRRENTTQTNNSTMPIKSPNPSLSKATPRSYLNVLVGSTVKPTVHTVPIKGEIDSTENGKKEKLESQKRHEEQAKEANSSESDKDMKDTEQTVQKEEEKEEQEPKEEREGEQIERKPETDKEEEDRIKINGANKKRRKKKKKKKNNNNKEDKKETKKEDKNEDDTKQAEPNASPDANKENQMSGNLAQKGVEKPKADDDMKGKKERYKMSHKLGEGVYGVVYKATDVVTGATVAVKKVRLDSEEGVPSTSIREIAALKELKHDNIVRLLDVVLTETKLHLVFEYMDKDLKAYMNFLSSPMQPDLIKSYMFQLLHGLNFCHAHRVLHRDLKPQNILINNDGDLKIADLGLVRAFGIPLKNYTEHVATLWYRPPELLLGFKMYGISLDMWSAGCIFAEMLQNAPLFNGDSEIDMLKKIFKVLGTPTDEMWPGVSEKIAVHFKKPEISKPKPWKQVLPKKTANTAIDLLSQMLQYDPAKRITCKQALQHPYFNSVDKAVYTN